ncbi:hypothetical protein GCM10017083_09270 [Thalassobaculum fulvum]|uniref:PAS domain-containing protein n=1 Tax=Thalassobaculum fulvum TaxID=1633335 RepID=A0A918XNZ8_9PROT|nr:hypothetical protein GCM10017083_09270 [Thalassobaculum fulvum]
MPTVPSQYLDDIDPDNPPHVAGSVGGNIVEIADPGRWYRAQHDFKAWFDRHAVAGFLPPGTPIDRLARHLGHVHKLEVGRDGEDFRYRIYGNLIAAEANMRMQGRWVSELPEPTRGIFLAHYRALLAAPRLFIGELRYVGDAMSHPVWYRAEAPIGMPETGMLGVIVLTRPTDLDEDPETESPPPRG